MARKVFIGGVQTHRTTERRTSQLIDSNDRLSEKERKKSSNFDRIENCIRTVKQDIEYT